MRNREVMAIRHNNKDVINHTAVIPLGKREYLFAMVSIVNQEILDVTHRLSVNNDTLNNSAHLEQHEISELEFINGELIKDLRRLERLEKDFKTLMAMKPEEFSKFITEQRITTTFTLRIPREENNNAETKQA